MDEEQLRQSLLNEKLAAERAEEERRDALLAEAAEIRARFPRCTDPAEKTRLTERYHAIDRELDEIKGEDGYSGSGYVPSWMRKKSQGELARERRREELERGRRAVLDQGKAGAGANTFQRIRSELNYLLNNYTESNDAKIEALIDKWRTSGDPSYDPGIRARLRNARAKKSKRDNPF